MKDTLTEMKNNLHWINSRLDKTKNKNRGLEYKEAKNKQKTN